MYKAKKTNQVKKNISEKTKNKLTIFNYKAEKCFILNIQNKLLSLGIKTGSMNKWDQVLDILIP